MRARKKAGIMHDSSATVPFGTDPFGTNPSDLLFIPVSLDKHGSPVERILSSQPQEGFELRAAREYSEGELALHDSFDWRLYARGMQLYSIEEVSGPSTSRPVYSLRGKRAGKGAGECTGEPPLVCSLAPDAPRYPFAAHFADAGDGGSRAADCLADVTKIRAFIERGRLRYSGTRYHLLDDIEKRIAELDIYLFRPGTEATHGLLMLRGSPLRGFNKELSTFLQGITGQEHLQENWYEALIRLSGAAPLDYSSRVRLSFDPDAPVSTVGGEVVDYFFSIMRRNEEGIREDIDTEFLHDYRVALRRLRSFVSEITRVFPEQVRKKFSTELKELFSLTTHVRDFDVLILKQDEFSSMIPEEFREGLELFFDWAEERRNSHLREFIAYTESSGYEEFMQRWSGYAGELQKAVPHDGAHTVPERQDADARATPGQAAEPHRKQEASISELALGRIRTRARKVHRVMEELEAAYSAEKLHNLRIQCKKLRYLSEIFASLFPDDDAGPFIKRLKKLQNVIGDHHDAVVQQKTLMRAVEELSVPKTELLKAVGALTTRLRDRELELFGHIDEEVESYMSYLDTKAPRFLFDEAPEPGKP